MESNQDQESSPSNGFPQEIWDRLQHLDSHIDEKKYTSHDFPKVSIVIPTYNSAQTIGMTLDSILNQDYPHFEVIIVDCSTDRTLEIVRSYKSEKIHTFSTDQCKRFDLLNKGLMQATGKYVNFLFPGDYYIYHKTLKNMMILALDNKKPQMVYCGTQLRDPKGEVKTLYRDLNIDNLKLGNQPTTLQASWFRTDILLKIGKFNPNYKFRSAFDLICRLFTQIDFRFVSIKRVLVDSEPPIITWHRVIVYFWETLKTINRYFGFVAMLKWLRYQKDFYSFIKLWLQQLKAAFLGH